VKFLKGVIKNFKMLFRIKTTLFAIIFGPLFIIFLIGLAFNTSSGISISIGYSMVDNSSLSYDFVNSLQEEGYLVQAFSSKNDCVQGLKDGIVHMCLVFPENFVIKDNKSNELVFVVDKTRINIVYEILDSVSKDIGVQTDALSKSLTDKLTTTLVQTASTLDKDLVSLVSVKGKLSGISTDANTISSNLGKIDLNSNNVDVDYSNKVKQLNDYAKEITDEVIDVTNQILSDSSASSVHNISLNLQEFSEDKYSDSEDYLDVIQKQINSTKTALDDLENKLSKAKSLTKENQNKIQSLRTKIGEIQSDVDSVKRDLEGITTSINTIKVKSSDQIVNPITTKVETISSKNNKLAVMFPYALLLVLMFISLFLSSSIVVLEKKSKASFRVFTTPTRDEFYIFSTFVTAFLIVLVEITTILLLSNFLFLDFISANLLVNSVIILLSIAVFVLLGMAIGYIFSSQQATNMASLSVGAIFLFISNMVLPIESISQSFQQIARLNPYVLASESLRRSILFSTSINGLSLSFLILSAYTLGLLILIVFVQKISKNLYFTRKPTTLAKQLNSIKTLVIHEREVYNEKEFIIAINRLTEEEYEDVVRQQERDIKHFLKNQLRYRKLARKFTSLTKKELLEEFAKQYDRRYKELKKHEDDLVKKLTESKERLKKQ